jgi:hypothetical protein
MVNFGDGTVTRQLGSFEPAGLSLHEAAVVDMKWFGLKSPNRRYY